MGQDCSFPCAATRKEQMRRLKESKYDPDLFDDDFRETIDERKSERQHNIDRIQQIIERQKQTSRNKIEDDASSARKMRVPPSPSHSLGTQSPFSFTDDSVADNEAAVLFLAEEIDNIEALVAKFSEKYSQMAPTILAPHPSENKAIVVLQATNTIANIAMHKQHKYYDFEKNLKILNNNTAYQILVKFLKQQYDDGLEYLGYYLDHNDIYHFIFCETDSLEEHTNLDFYTLADMSQSEIQATLNKAVKEHYKLKGVITLRENKETPKPLSFVMVEKKKKTLNQYILVKIAGVTFHINGPNFDFSKKIELGCQSDQLDIAGLISNYEEDTLYLVFSSILGAST